MDAGKRKEELRHKAKTDLFWLCKKVLGYNDLVEHVHRPVCEFFVHKDPDKPFADQDTIKNRLLLDPRDHFKTSIDIGDCVQWILNFPNIRINILSGTDELVTRMLSEIKHHFHRNEDMRFLFPEYCADPNKDFGNTEEFTVPARTKFMKEPTVSTFTLNSAKASAHFDVEKCDDVVHEKNITNAELIKRTNESIGYLTPLLVPWGYRDFVGTRYDYSDYYGTIVDDFAESLRQEIPFGWKIETEQWKVMVRQVWIPGSEPGKVKLLFPERFGNPAGLARLLDFRKKHPYLFNCQYFNNPETSEKKSFTEESLVAHTIPVTQIPRTGRVFQVWDLGYSKQNWADYSCCATGLFDEMGRLFILDLDVGRYSPNELVSRIIHNFRKWRPQVVGIEEANGAPMLGPGLELACRMLGISYLPVEWLKVKNTKDAKDERIGSLLTLLDSNYLFFSAAIPCFEDFKKQFTRWNRYAHDDIPDAIALLVEHFRTRIDIVPQNQRVEIISAHTVPGCEELGCGLVG